MLGVACHLQMMLSDQVVEANKFRIKIKTLVLELHVELVIFVFYFGYLNMIP